MESQRYTYQPLPLTPHPDDGKVWVAELIGPHETYRLHRQFLQPDAHGNYQMYDGWYQINGYFAGISPFTKEYVMVMDGQMTRGLRISDMIDQLEAIENYQPHRLRRLQQQIDDELDELYEKFPEEEIAEQIMQQKDDAQLETDVLVLYRALSELIRRKPQIIQHYEAYFAKKQDFLNQD